MKHLSLTLLAVAFAWITQAQTLPKSGAALKANSNTIELTNEQKTTVDVTRLRSKSYTKAKFGAIKVNTPEGLEATVVADENDLDRYVIHLESAPSLESGTYTITIQGEGRNASKVKGTMLTIKVDDTQLAKSN